MWTSIFLLYFATVALICTVNDRKGKRCVFLWCPRHFTLPLFWNKLKLGGLVRPCGRTRGFALLSLQRAPGQQGLGSSFSQYLLTQPVSKSMCPDLDVPHGANSWPS